MLEVSSAFVEEAKALVASVADARAQFEARPTTGERCLAVMESRKRRKHLPEAPPLTRNFFHDTLNPI